MQNHFLVMKCHSLQLNHSISYHIVFHKAFKCKLRLTRKIKISLCIGSKVHKFCTNIGRQMPHTMLVLYYLFNYSINVHRTACAHILCSVPIQMFNFTCIPYTFRNYFGLPSHDLDRPLGH